MIEAKEAIVDEQFQRFLTLEKQEHWEEAAKQLVVTLACVSDLLEEGALALSTPGNSTVSDCSTGVRNVLG